MFGFKKRFFIPRRRTRPHPVFEDHLACCRPGQRVRVKRIDGGWGMRQRLGQLGIHPGDEIIVTRGGALGGPIVISVHGIQVAIGRGMARKIKVDGNEPAR